MLVLPIKKKWFDMILSGEKKEEYRETSAYWKVRFSHVFPMYPHSFIPMGGVPKKVLFRNGYKADSPAFIAECSLDDIRKGKEEWGAEKDREYYVIKIHSIFDVKNV